jgi:hypothetical protein
VEELRNKVSARKEGAQPTRWEVGRRFLAKRIKELEVKLEKLKKYFGCRFRPPAQVKTPP